MSSDLASRGPIGAKTVPIVIGVLLITMAVLLTVDLFAAAEASRRAARTSTSRTAATGRPSACSRVVRRQRAAHRAARLAGLRRRPVLRHDVRARQPRLVRNVLISFALSVGSWYLFYVGLGIALPAGILKGIL